MKPTMTVEKIATAIFERTHDIEERGGEYQAECVVATRKILRAAMPSVGSATVVGITDLRRRRWISW